MARNWAQGKKTREHRRGKRPAPACARVLAGAGAPGQSKPGQHAHANDARESQAGASNQQHRRGHPTTAARN
eukprot:5391689-Lingulodinium_polyedra.AAC.1